MTLPVSRSLPWNHTTYDVGVTISVRTVGASSPSVIAKDHPPPNTLEAIPIKPRTRKPLAPEFGRNWDDVELLKMTKYCSCKSF